jgi:membrane peptidoglycan carboxypeptidase
MIAGPIAAMTSVLLVAVYLLPYPTERLDDKGPDWIVVEDIPAPIVMAIVQSEDHRFYDHGGVDGGGVLRAVWANYKSGGLIDGGSTITMQLVRLLHSPGEERTWTRKVEESVLAMRLERAVDKRTILEQYLNRAYFGHDTYGIGAASRLYFDKPAPSLSLAEGILLAAILREPDRFDPYRQLAATLGRRDHIVRLLVSRDLMSVREAERISSQRPSLAR